ncbi:hypothetical protein TWF730_006624 [Orbilia blumenaviensis]|uniref:F-box domain-containing protein n=1 Tax=Orbilia blumenaviensis TaxID=1796055 RepID=A0AAV9VH98_9PEZI
MPHILELPNEITGLILDELCCPEEFDELDDFIEWQVPLMLTCRRFRKLVLPRLYSACFMSFGIVGTEFRAVLSDDSARHIWHVRESCPEYGTLVKSLKLAIGGRFPVKGTVLDETEDFEQTRSLQSVLGWFVPRSNVLKRVWLRRHFDIGENSNLFDFCDAIRMVLSCSSLKELSLRIKFHNSDRETWEAEGRNISLGGSSAKLNTLDLSFYESKWTIEDAFQPVFGWLMGILIDLLEVPCQSVSSLCFSYGTTRFKESCNRSRLPDPIEYEGKIPNTTGRWLKFPSVKTLKVEMCRAGRWMFEQHINLGLGGIKSLTLSSPYDGVSESDATFMMKFKNLAFLHIQDPTCDGFAEWTTQTFLLSRACLSFREGTLYARFSASDPKVVRFMKDRGDEYNARIKSSEDPASEGFNLSIYPPRAN